MIDFRNRISPWYWIPSLYFAQGLPYVMVMTVSVIMYKRLGISNTDIALYTSWLYLPWVIKPFWSPIVDMFKTKRLWVLATQILMGAGFAGIALTLPADNFFRITLAVFWLLAFTSATHDIASDGFYMLALDVKEQSFFVGIRSTFYRIATIAGQGGLVVVAGWLEKSTGSITTAWSSTFLVVAALFVLIFGYHTAVLPKPDSDTTVTRERVRVSALFREFGAVFSSFFKKRHIVTAILFLLLYRFPEAQLVKLINPFLLDAV